MIPHNELRIGNYVLVDQTLEQVSMIDNSSSFTRAIVPDSKAPQATANIEHPLESLQPVPMNDAVLKQCGFVYQDYFKFWQLITDEGGNRSEMDIDRDYNVIDFMRKPVVKKVTSLHQLQNIYFMLKGKELSISSPQEAI